MNILLWGLPVPEAWGAPDPEDWPHKVHPIQGLEQLHQAQEQQRWDLCLLGAEQLSALRPHLQALRTQHPQTAYLLVTQDHSPQQQYKAMMEGVDELISPSPRAEHLHQAVHRRLHMLRAKHHEMRHLLALTRPEDAQVLRQELRREDFTVSPVHTPLDALSRLRGHLAPILVVDLMYPPFQGHELIRAALRYNPSLPIIALLAEETLSGEHLPAPREVMDMLTLPLQPNLVVEVVTRAWTRCALGSFMPRSACNQDRYLVLEPHPQDAQLLHSYLTQPPKALHTVVVDSVPQALLALRRQSFCALLLSLPNHKASLEALRTLRAAAPSLPILAILQEPSGEWVEELTRHGVRGSVAKPFLTQEHLRTSLRLTMERTWQQQSIERLVRDLYIQHNNQRGLIDQHPSGLLIVSRTGQIRFANPKAVELLGQSTGALLGTSLLQAITPLDLDPKQAHQLLQASQCPQRVMLERPGAAPLPAELSASAITWRNQEALLIQLQDLSERLATEQYKARLIRADHLAAIGQLAAGFAHEINNPASFIISNLTMLQRDVTGLLESVQQGRLSPQRLGEDLQDMQEMLLESQEGMERIRRITRSLQEFTHMHDHEIELTDLNQVVRTASEVIRRELRTYGRLELELRSLPRLVAHKGRLSQVVTNLLVNALHAIKSAPQRPHAIRVSTHHIDTEEAQIELQIHDTGCGISQAAMDRIFEPFFTTHPEGKGTGLGLPLSAEIVRQHNGQVSITSQEGEWTCATITLPVQNELKLPGRIPAPPPSRPSQKTLRPRLLLVDDEAMVLKSYARLLADQYEVVCATSAQEAIEQLAHNDAFEAIISDMMMQGCTGAQLYDMLEQAHPDLLGRLIFYTGGVYNIEVSQFLQKVHVPVLMKPVTPEALIQTIRSLQHDPPSQDPA